jgi:hypothetical protein
MNQNLENEEFARLILALEPWLTQIVIIGGWAYRLYRQHPIAQRVDYLLCRLSIQTLPSLPD